MIKNKKILFTLGAVALTPLFAVAAVSCGSRGGVVTPKELIGGVKLTNGGKDIVPVEKRKTILVTDAGRITDKSFNQSAYEGAYLAAKQHGLLTRDFLAELEPNGDSDIESQYQIAESNNYVNWLLPGFKHDDRIKKYWAEHKDKLKNSKTVMIGIDFNPQVDEGYGIGVNFDVKDSAFVIGYAAADWLAKKYPTDADKRSVFAFGGGEFDGVTSFIRGFFEGIKQYNKEHTTTKTKILLDAGKVILNSGFLTTLSTMTDAVNKAISSKATILLPVAGPATTVVVDALKRSDANKDRLVVGVDVDQAKSTPNDKNWFFSSVLKRIAQASYDIQTELYGKPENYNIIKGFELGKKSVKVLGTFDNNLIGYAPSSLEGDAKKAIDDSLALGKKAFDKITNKNTEFDQSGYEAAITGNSLGQFFEKLAAEANK